MHDPTGNLSDPSLSEDQATLPPSLPGAESAATLDRKPTQPTDIWATVAPSDAVSVLAETLIR